MTLLTEELTTQQLQILHLYVEGYGVREISAITKLSGPAIRITKHCAFAIGSQTPTGAPSPTSVLSFSRAPDLNTIATDDVVCCLPSALHPSRGKLGADAVNMSWIVALPSPTVCCATVQHARSRRLRLRHARAAWKGRPGLASAFRQHGHGAGEARVRLACARRRGEGMHSSAAV